MPPPYGPYGMDIQYGPYYMVPQVLKLYTSKIKFEIQQSNEEYDKKVFITNIANNIDT